MSAEHHEKEYSIFQIAINLMCACLVSGLIIASVYFVTAPIAAKNAEEQKMQSMQELVPDADKFVAIEGHDEWFEAQKGGKTVAYVVPSETKGYGGKIELLVAINADGSVKDYAILKANETPGLGDKAGKEPFKSQIVGKTAEFLVVTKDPSKTENVQAMTGATISSKAVTKGIKQAVDEVNEFVGGSK